MPAGRGAGYTIMIQETLNQGGSHWRSSVSALMMMLATATLPGCQKSAGPEGGTAQDNESAAFGQRIIKADQEPQNWLSTGRNYQETRFSPLTDIDGSNVARLGLQWSYDLDTDRGQESTPIVVDGVVYTTSAWSKIQAFDAVTGKLKWQFDPQVPGATLIKACCDAVNRGAAFWNGKVYVGTLDGRLIAVNAATGKQVWSVVTVDQSKNYTITGAPRIVKGRVIIGNGGADLGRVRGYVTAYDAETGAQDWRFYTVPGEPGKPDGAASDKVLAKLAAKTWSGNWWKDSGGGGGGTVWDSMAYDPDLDLLYLGVGNSSYWNKKYRSPGDLDNLFVASIVAIRPETGEYVWHYQETPGDSWDYTATQHMILADINIAGVVRKVLMQAPKNGFFYILDRATGKLLSAKPYVHVNWAKGIDERTGRPIYNPDALYWKTGKPWISMPGSLGAHSWNPMSYSPRTGLVYIPAQEIGGLYETDPAFTPQAKGVNLGIKLTAFAAPDEPKALAAVRKSLKGYLIAWDPKTQKEVWRAPHSGPWNGGVLSTAGDLVFQGDVDGFFNIYDAKSGRKLWSFDTGSAISAAPVTYSVNGRQYVTVLAGWGTVAAQSTGKLGWDSRGARVNKSRVLTFALDGKQALPAREPLPSRTLSPPPRFGSADTIKYGEWAYARTCLNCHGGGAVAAGRAPDLRYSAALGNDDAWKAILIDGALADNGMVSFKEDYTPEQLNAIRAYIVSRAHAGAAGSK